MESEAAFNAGDICFDCQQNGLQKHLRYFKINLNGDTILKCESDECMYPYNDEMYSSEEEETAINNISQTSSLNLINDLIEQYNYEEGIEDTINHIQINDNIADQVTHFDITFLDGINENKTENLCKPEFAVENKECLVNDIDVNISENKYFSMPTTILNKCEISPEITNVDGSGKNDKLPNFIGVSKKCSETYEIPPPAKIKDCKTKINIQSVETVKYENPLYHHSPTSSKNFTITNIISSQSSNLPKTAILQQKKTLKTTRKTKSQVKLKSRTSTFDSKKSELPVPQTSDIPKADILKANAFLKKLATMDSNEKPPKISIKCKQERDKKIAVKAKTDEKKLTEPSSNNDSNYSFDKISQMLSTKP